MLTSDTEEELQGIFDHSDMEDDIVGLDPFEELDQDGIRPDDLWHKPNPPEVTLSAFTETGREESTIPVLQQRSYTARKLIPSALANTLCAALGVAGVVEKINEMLDTSYALDRFPVLESYIESCIKQNFDFGTFYGRFRNFSAHNEICALAMIDGIERVLRELEEEDTKKRQMVLCDGKIRTKQVRPRRVWDLHANRVVPYWVTASRPCAISHAWMDEKDRVDVWTPINGMEWPVPMPKDADLNLIRIEMLNLGARYAWLDVLCLRQKYDAREDHLEEDQRREALRVEEWKLDVPTIGFVYNAESKPRVVYYLSGLGRPLSLTPGFFDSDRCWFNRAWTLQEIGREFAVVIAGDTGDSSLRTMFHEKMESLQNMYSPDDFISQMKDRVSTKPIDRVAGLVYSLDLRYVPIYDADQSVESAWEQLMNAMKRSNREQLFLSYPVPGNGHRYWRPSWTQVMDVTCPELAATFCEIGQTEETDVDWFKGCCVESAHVRGLADTANKERPRRGELVVTGRTRVPRTFEISADHGYSIQEGSYTLLHAGFSGNQSRLNNSWVVGQKGKDGRFQKLSVINMGDIGVIQEELHELCRLGVLKEDVMMILC
ncbi:hypothetical protein EV421DRAFT_2061348 [Armillaria borealis]|uniref:Heterokaryon incompatibility domain-containing protein n=1 Tax=Armillaria borealis TaxID=47425 RepID=A0AA39J6H3_9AGAR|nr:hypothetical protein EV421DRAFT_2061348 [Armillaria borealis]